MSANLAAAAAVMVGLCAAGQLARPLNAMRAPRPT